MTLRWYKKIAFRIACRRQPPEMIARDGKENYLAGYIEFSDSPDENYRIVSVGRNFLEVRVLSHDHIKYEACIPFSRISDENFSVLHWYYGLQIDYRSYFDFLRGSLLMLALRAWLKDRVAQWIFNARTKFRDDRIYLLKRIVAREMRGGRNSESFSFDSQAIGTVFLFSEIYGLRAFNHPRFEMESRRFALLIEALKESGDLKEENGKIYLLPRSVITISEYEVEEKRHKDNVRLNLLIGILTVVVGAASIFS
ncbi:MAG: hypothetical protein ACE368_01950 [Paracoccaceae bacterium]